MCVQLALALCQSWHCVHPLPLCACNAMVATLPDTKACQIAHAFAFVPKLPFCAALVVCDTCSTCSRCSTCMACAWSCHVPMTWCYHAAMLPCCLVATLPRCHAARVCVPSSLLQAAPQVPWPQVTSLSSSLSSSLSYLPLHRRLGAPGVAVSMVVLAVSMVVLALQRAWSNVMATFVMAQTWHTRVASQLFVMPPFAAMSWQPLRQPMYNRILTFPAPSRCLLAISEEGPGCVQGQLRFRIRV